MPTASDPGRSNTPGRRTTSNQSPNSTPKNEIHVHTNQMQKPSIRKHYNTHSLRAPFFLMCIRSIEGFANFVYFINFWTGEQAQSQVCKQAEWTTNVINGHYMLASPSTKANGIKQMSQTQTPGQSKSCFGKRQL